MTCRLCQKAPPERDVFGAPMCEPCARRAMLRAVRLRRVFDLLRKRGVRRELANAYVINRWIDKLPREVWWVRPGSA